jgi:hypothetical protein
MTLGKMVYWGVTSKIHALLKIKAILLIGRGAP